MFLYCHRLEKITLLDGTLTDILNSEVNLFVPSAISKYLEKFHAHNLY